ncbi:DNA-binding GntR family transcriptional regulator [Brevundimonas vesicularis]|uniref:GntR family transcriptional regulator n=1 Tax=Brevundimonas vesicularis TaxID=41276 RepID=UPI002784F499|nr:GntR family transcriptional regulator [Brevundimonas vesicularis]MDQ1193786.1 DNA-binding GntR family transcriptional regulator [Brevundimonas vesicularis]
MARNRDPFTQALASLRDRIHSGALAGGAQVIVQDEAQRLRLSTTPVREALARLSGEGLVERAASGGYVTVRFDAAAARDRWAMHAQYVRIAVELNARALGALRPPAPPFEPDRPIVAADRLFSSLVCSAGNRVLWDAFRTVSGQLDLVRRYETVLFDDLGEEARGLYAAYSEAVTPAFAEAVGRYHDRRMGAAGALAALVFGGAGPPAARTDGEG